MKILRRIRYFFQQRQRESDLAEEIEFHRSMSSAAGEMGNITLAREDARAVWIAPWLQSVWQDVSYALRGLRREPGFTLMALLALGTAIGLNTSLFSVFNAVLLKSWRVKEPSQMVRIFTRSPQPTNGAFGLAGLSVVEFRYLAEHTRTFSGLISMAQRRVSFGFEPFGKGSTAVLVAADHFRALETDLHIGRGFLPEEDRTSAPEAVMVLSYELWRDHFGSDAAILGKRVPVNDVPFTVVGVAPEKFSLRGEHEDVWIPFPAVQLLFPNDPNQRDWLSSPTACCEPIAGRLAPGVTREKARAELEVLSNQFRASIPSSIPNASAVAVVLGEPTMLSGDPASNKVGRIFGMMFLGVTLIVLLACANVGNLLVARAAARQREIEIRRAIGASRARVVRQLMTESFLLALGAGAMGILIAFRLPAIAVALLSEDDPPVISLTPDWTVLGYVLVLALLSCLCFGLAPALHGTHPRPMRARLKLRSWLLASQVALSVVLLTGAGLLLRGVQRAVIQDLGFAIEGAAATSFELPASALNQPGILGFAAALQRDLPATGLDHFALSLRAPLEGNWYGLYRLPEESRDQLKPIDLQEVSPGYFDVLRIPLVSGRDFNSADAGRPVIIVNESGARIWNNSDAVGKTLVVGGIPREVIGVARNTYAAQMGLTGPMLYQPLRGFDVPKVIFRAGPAGTAGAIEAVARRIQPGTRAQTLSLLRYKDLRFAPSRAMAQMAATLGLFALALASVGMFGVFAYAVRQRTKEIGIRMALGARPSQVVKLVVLGTSRALVLGLAAGFLGAAAAARLIADYLYGLSPLDPRAYAYAAIILAAAALAASYLPSRRACRIDPLAALRHE